MPRFLKVKTWRAEITYHREQPLFATYTERFSCVLTFDETIPVRRNRSLKWRGRGDVSGQVKWNMGSEQMRSKGHSTGVELIEAHFRIDHQPWARRRWQRRGKLPSNPPDYNLSVALLVDLVSDGTPKKERIGFGLHEELPDTGLVLSGESIEDNAMSRQVIRWTIRPADQGEPRYFLRRTMPPEGFEPAPDTTVSFSLQPQGDANPNLTFPLRFVLTEISKEPGTCLNSIETEVTPDAEFDHQANAQTFRPAEAQGDDQVLLTHRPESEATAVVRLKDYGPWAKVSGEYLYEHNWQPAQVEGSEKLYLTVVEDENENRVWDEWERQHQVLSTNHPAAWDEEAEPHLDGQQGDGYSLYEEYRGVMADRVHTRLDPSIKELVVENQIDHQGVRQGIQLFARASGIDVIELAKGELPADRVANTNSRSHRNHRQHGVIVLEKDLQDKDGVAQTQPVQARGKTPKDTEQVVIDTDHLGKTYQKLPPEQQALTDPVSFARLWAAVVASTVAHELGHSVGAAHHGDKDYPAQQIVEGDEVYDERGRPLAQPPAFTTDPTGAPHGQSSGDVQCVMYYKDLYQWMLDWPQGGRRRFFKVPPGGPAQSIFCTSPTGTGINRGAKLFGNAASGRGNCIAQLRVRDIDR